MAGSRDDYQLFLGTAGSVKLVDEGAGDKSIRIPVDKQDRNLCLGDFPPGIAFVQTVPCFPLGHPVGDIHQGEGGEVVHGL